MVFTEIENKKKSFTMTTALFALLFLLLFFLKFSNQILIPELEGGGGGGEVAVNFGDSDFGSGDNYQSTEKVLAAPKQTQPVVSSEKEIVVSENEDAPAIAEIKKPTEKPKKIEIVKPIVKEVPKPAKSTSDALSNLLNGSNKSGDGDDKEAGNKGKANGDKNASGYNGGGGTGTGSGGGNGSGQGLGTGSGYGNGSGSGTGNGNGNYQLTGRKVLKKSEPKDNCNLEATVVVEITVDKTGKVIKATSGARGTTDTSSCLALLAKTSALNTRFDPNPDAPEQQVGKIIYKFSYNN